MTVDRKIHSGLDNYLNDLYGCVRRKTFPLEKLRKEAAIAEQYGLALVNLSDRELRERLEEYRVSIRLGKKGDVLLQALGLVCECSCRTLSIRPYVEQVMGALAIYRGIAIQMQTGEGKTITAAVAASLAAWGGKPCHIVTSNDYLAKRDAELMTPLYKRCGLTVGHVIGTMPPQERKAAYDCDITYSTSKELLADFLRDRMAEDAASQEGSLLVRRIATGNTDDQRVMRGLYTAIVDEADSVLADEATVPLIISQAGKNRLMKEAVMNALSLTRDLSLNEDYTLEASHFDIKMKPQGERKIEAALKGLSGIWSSYERSEYLIKQALVARHFYHRDVHYVVYEEKIVIVDEKTGRMMEGRSWSSGLHQAVEAKECVELTDVTESHTQMSFQLFFRQYRHLSGMSGTLQNIERELWGIYGLIAVNIPTHVPKRISFYPEKTCLSSEDKWVAVTEDILRHRSRGRAVLVGTRSIRESLAMYDRLLSLGVDATVLNALHHEQEATIIAQAGKKGRVTIATNMAGRGTDILLDRDVVEAQGLHVIATERHESRRVDMQLFGRTARQGLPGSGQMVVSLDDEVLLRFAPAWLVAGLK
ncbi:MAG: DEAD/DEAH box helicase, partial [Deltaproteobacteria bacterium]